MSTPLISGHLAVILLMGALAGVFAAYALLEAMGALSRLRQRRMRRAYRVMAKPVPDERCSILQFKRRVN